jgi:hypothetical protein
MLNLTLKALVEVDIVRYLALISRISYLGTTAILTNVTLYVSMTAAVKSSFCQNTTGGICSI